MAEIEPGPDNDYQVSPTLSFSRERWNLVMASIAARLKARELLEATFEALITNGTQAALDMISVNVAPQLESLIEQINALEEQLEDIIGGGTAPNALQLGGQSPSYYLALANATGTLPVAQVTGVQSLIDAAVASLVNGSPATLDTLKELSDALGGDASFAANMAAALGARIRFDAAQSLNSTQIAQALANLALTNRQVPAGSIVSVIGTAAPPGFLKANGASLSRSTYADLWAYAQACGALVDEATFSSGRWGCFSTGDGSTTFRIPDLRGEFIRAWDDGRSIDSGRTIGSSQGSQNLSHNHGVSDPGHSHGVYDPGHSHGVNDPGHTHRMDSNIWMNLASPGGSNYSTPAGSGYYLNNIGGLASGGSGTGIWLSGSGTGISIYGAGTGVSIQTSGGSEARPRSVSLLQCIKF